MKRRYIHARRVTLRINRTDDRHVTAEARAERVVGASVVLVLIQVLVLVIISFSLMVEF